MLYKMSNPSTWISLKMRNNKKKIGRNWNFWMLDIKNMTYLNTFLIFVDILCFFHAKRWKTYLHFCSKMAWPPKTYDVIYRNHSNWLSPILCQNVCKGYANSYWKWQALITIVSKTFKKNLMGGGIPPSPNCTSEGQLVSRHFLLEEDQVRRLLSMKLLYWERAVLSYVISTQTPRSLMSMLR